MHTLRNRSRTNKLAVLPRVPKPNMPRVWRKTTNRPTPKQEQPRQVSSYMFDCVLIYSLTRKTFETMEQGLDPMAKAYEAGREDAKKKALEIADNIDNTADRTLIKDMLEDLL